MKAIAIVIALLVAHAPRADACSCSPPPPACEAYQHADAIFVGKVTGIVEASGGAAITFAVTQKLKGHVEAEQIIEGGGMCGSVFQKGKTYVVYATGTGGKLSSSLCGRTALADKARDDISYAKGFDKRTLGIVEGDVAVTEPEGAQIKRAGVEVRVRGSKFRARTDKAGHYKLELPPGKYTLDVVDPKARTSADTNETVNLADSSSCEVRPIAVVWNGRVRGRVTGVDGKPAVAVNLTLVSQGSSHAGNAFAMTDATGTFEFSGVQAGEYTVVAYNAKGVPTSTFYPGVDDPAKAKPIKLSQSALVQRIDFKLLP
jgi:hypothetical protein